MVKADFTGRVMQILNELGWSEDLEDIFIGSDTTKVERHIEAVFTDAWRKAIGMFPKEYFTVKDFSDCPVNGDMNAGTGYVVLPEDFYVLYRLRMKGWQRAVETFYTNEDPVAVMQSNEYVRGNIIRPVCVLTERGVQVRTDDEISTQVQKALEYYSLPRGVKHEIAEALYIPIMQPLSDETVLSKELFAPLSYLCAGLVLRIFEKPETAAIAESIAGELVSGSF